MALPDPASSSPVWRRSTFCTGYCLRRSCPLRQHGVRTGLRVPRWSNPQMLRLGMACLPARSRGRKIQLRPANVAICPGQHPLTVLRVPAACRICRSAADSTGAGSFVGSGGGRDDHRLRDRRRAARGPGAARDAGMLLSRAMDALAEAAKDVHRHRARGRPDGHDRLSSPYTRPLAPPRVRSPEGLSVL